MTAFKTLHMMEGSPYSDRDPQGAALQGLCMPISSLFFLVFSVSLSQTDWNQTGPEGGGCTLSLTALALYHVLWHSFDLQILNKWHLFSNYSHLLPDIFITNDIFYIITLFFLPVNNTFYIAISFCTLWGYEGHPLLQWSSAVRIRIFWVIKLFTGVRLKNK